MATRMITQLLVFVVFGFAPVLYPLSQMPRWLGAVNWWLPFRHMAVVTRAALTPGRPRGGAFRVCRALRVGGRLCRTCRPGARAATMTAGVVEARRGTSRNPSCGLASATGSPAWPR